MDKVIKMYRAALVDYIRFDREKEAACREVGDDATANDWGHRASVYETAMAELDSCIAIYNREAKSCQS